MPQGHVPIKFKQGKKGTSSVAFASEHCGACPQRERCPIKAGRKRHYLRFDLKALRSAGRRAREHTPEFKEKYRWRSGIESTFLGMDKQTGIKHLRVRGLDAVGYCARLKAIGVNLFRAARVKIVLDALRPAPGAVSAVICSIIGDVKEHFVSPWRRLSDILNRRLKICSTPSESPREFLRVRQYLVLALRLFVQGFLIFRIHFKILKHQS